MKIYQFLILLFTILLSGCTTMKPYDFKDFSFPNEQGLTIDCKGKTISTFIIFYLFQGLSEIENDQYVDLIIDNTDYVKNDIVSWANYCDIQILSEEEIDGSIQIRFVKQSQINKGKSFALALAEDGLGELLSPLGFALGAALSGYDVRIFLNGPAVKIVEKGFKEKLSGFSRIFSGFARRGLNNIGHISPTQKLLQLKQLGAEIYICGPSADQFKLNRNKVIIEDVKYVEYMTIIPILAEADINFFIQ
ncbi:MAG: DsrE family protein [Spirochaetaceae bacterium]|nr:DsrE family protein [Spirochaetaceae bacterium]